MRKRTKRSEEEEDEWGEARKEAGGRMCEYAGVRGGRGEACAPPTRQTNTHKRTLTRKRKTKNMERKRRTVNTARWKTEAELIIEKQGEGIGKKKHPERERKKERKREREREQKEREQKVFKTNKEGFWNELDGTRFSSHSPLFLQVKCFFFSAATATCCCYCCCSFGTFLCYY
jgi:hypothetical protein